MPQIIVAPPGTDLNRSLGWMAADWIQSNCVHGFGDVYGQAVKLEDDVIKLLMYLYAVNERGRRLVKQAVACMPKGSAKSELASLIALFETFGPCRATGEIAKGGGVYTCPFTGWTWTYEPGDMIARRIDSTFVRIMATDLEQAKRNSFKTVFLNLAPDGSWPIAGSARQGKTGILDEATGSEIVFSSSSAPSKDGGLESFTITEEIHLYTTAELRDAYKMMYDNLDKRPAAEPWTFSPTTMHVDGQNSTGEQIHKEAMTYLRSPERNVNGLLYYWNSGFAVDDLSDVDAVRASLAEAYQGRTYIDIEAIARKPMSGQTSPQTFRQKYLNQLTVGQDMFVSSVELERATSTETGEPIRPLEVGDEGTIGIDGSWGNKKDAAEYGSNVIRKPDAFAVVFYRFSDSSLHPIIIEEATPADMEGKKTWQPDTEKILNAIHAAFAKYKVRGVFADPSGIQGILDQLTQKYGKRLTVKASQAFPMYRWMSGDAEPWFARQIAVYYEELAAGRLKIVGGPFGKIAEHHRNARRRLLPRSEELWSVQKKSKHSEEKIDAVPASVLAWAAGRIALNRGVDYKPKRPARARVVSRGVM